MRPGQVPQLTLVRDAIPRTLPELRDGPIRSVGRVSDPTDWKLPLQSLLGSDGNDAVEPGDADIGLQFELVLDPGGAGIRVRPVAPGPERQLGQDRDLMVESRLLPLRGTPTPRRPNGSAWSRSCWHSAGWPTAGACTAMPMRWCGSRPSTVGDCGTSWAKPEPLGLPLVQSGRTRTPITFLPAAAAVTIDVTRTEAGLQGRAAHRDREPTHSAPGVHAHRSSSARHRLVGRADRTHRTASHLGPRAGRAGHAGGRQSACLPQDGCRRRAPVTTRSDSCGRSFPSSAGGWRWSRATDRSNCPRVRRVHAGPHHRCR